MWDLQKSINAARGAIKRKAEGKDPIKMTDDERIRFDETFACIDANLAARDRKEGV